MSPRAGRAGSALFLFIGAVGAALFLTAGKGHTIAVWGAVITAIVTLVLAAAVPAVYRKRRPVLRASVRGRKRLSF